MKMKRFTTLFISLLVANVMMAQINSANYVVDYSDAIICGMDEESFAVYEPDWHKDQPQITGGIIGGLMDKLEKTIPFRKSSKNTIKVTILRITDHGTFTGDIALYDENGNLVAEAKNIRGSKGGNLGSKLHLMKEGSEKIGRSLGSALKSAIKKQR